LPERQWAAAESSAHDLAEELYPGIALTALISRPAAEPGRLRRRAGTEQSEKILEEAAAGTGRRLGAEAPGGCGRCRDT
jgi:hypothetical protein